MLCKSPSIPLLFLSLSLLLVVHLVEGRASVGQSDREAFIAHARDLWEGVQATKEHLGGQNCDKQAYCRALQDMLNHYPNPQRHIWDYIYTGNGQGVPDEVAFMRDIYGELMWAFESDNI